MGSVSTGPAVDRGGGMSRGGCPRTSRPVMIDELMTKARQALTTAARDLDGGDPDAKSGSSPHVVLSFPSRSWSTPMNAADLITREVADLPDALRAEVLDFIGFLKTRHPTEVGKTAPDVRLADLTAFFAPYRRDLGSFAFDREEANAR